MTATWPKVRLGEALRRVERPEVPRLGVSYRQLGVRLWGEGAYEREPLEGGATRYATLSQVAAYDVVVNKIWARNGSVAVVPPTLAGCFVSGEFPTFATISNILLPRWIHWLTKVPDFWAQCDDKSRGTSGKNRIKPEQFLSVEIPLPPLPEQRRIVARIEALAAQIGEARSLRHQAAEEAEALLPSETNAVFTDEAMLGWPTKPLEEIADIRSGVTLGRRLTGRTVRLPYLRVANVQDGHLDLGNIKEVEVLESEVDKWTLQRGDLLLTEGGDWDKLGRGTVWREEIPRCIHQNHIFRLRMQPKDFIPEFVARLISSPVGKAYFQEASKQTTNLASINQRQLKAFRVYQPPLPEQRRVVAFLDSVQGQVDALKRLQAETANELDALLPSILDRAYKGEL